MTEREVSDTVILRLLKDYKDVFIKVRDCKDINTEDRGRLLSFYSDVASLVVDDFIVEEKS
jgi:translation initiation factor 2 beta subunit (eIF-2beta)/eIF-5